MLPLPELKALGGIASVVALRLGCEVLGHWGAPALAELEGAAVAGRIAGVVATGAAVAWLDVVRGRLDVVRGRLDGVRGRPDGVAECAVSVVIVSEQTPHRIGHAARILEAKLPSSKHQSANFLTQFFWSSMPLQRCLVAVVVVDVDDDVEEAVDALVLDVVNVWVGDVLVVVRVRVDEEDSVDVETEVEDVVLLDAVVDVVVVLVAHCRSAGWTGLSV